MFGDRRGFKPAQLKTNKQTRIPTLLLGDAVVEFITSVHLFHMFPDLEEGGLATYRAALVQNQHLAILAEVLGKSLYELKSVLKTKSSKYSGFMHCVSYHILLLKDVFC